MRYVMKQKLWSWGIRDVGVIQASHPLTDYSRPVQIASVQTLERRYQIAGQLSRSVPSADLVLIEGAGSAMSSARAHCRFTG